MSKVLIIGADGQLGTDLCRTSPSSVTVISHGLKDCDITDNDQTIAYLEKVAPDVIINTAAFHQTDQCEDDPDTSFALNSIAVRNLAKACNKAGIVLVHISTDYVFDGVDKNTPYLEDDRPQPINIYGASKIAGEFLVQHELDSHYIVRVASLFGKTGAAGKGTNFVYTMLRLAKDRDEFKVIDDIIMSPTYTIDAANAIWELVMENHPYGIYHLTNEGQCSWYEFAKKIFELSGLKKEVVAVPHTEYPTKAQRPLWSVLGTNSDIELPIWEDGLKRFLEEIKG